MPLQTKGSSHKTFAKLELLYMYIYSTVQYSILFAKDRSTYPVLTFFFLLLSLTNSELTTALSLLHPVTSTRSTVSFGHSRASKEHNVGCAFPFTLSQSYLT